MNECLNLRESNCRNCYKCIRHCTVKAISFSVNQANILQEECILCGQCFVNCPQNAKGIRNDLPLANKLLSGNEPVIASIAPSFAANYCGAGIEAMRKALQALGFAGAEETAIGAAIVKNRYETILASGRHPVLISSCCHTVNMLIQRYYPGALPALAKTQSPMLAHAAYIKKTNPGAKVVFIGPCISKKAEADQYPGIVDCVLTFEELTEWMGNKAIEIPTCADTEQGGKTRLFPLAGGILRSMDTSNKDYRYLVIDGLDNCVAALEEISKGGLERCFIEMSACKGSCVGGPVMEHRGAATLSGLMAVEGFAGENDFTVNMPADSELEKNIPVRTVAVHAPDSAAIAETLRKMGKKKPSDELNCGSCGYNSCREKAAAILSGKADISMCLPYLMAKAQSFSDTIINNTPNGIIVLNEALEVQQINTAACALMNVRNSSDVLGGQVVRILDPSIFAEVISTRRNIREQRVFLAEYQRYVKLTVIHDISYHIVIIIMRDITAEEIERVRKEELSRKTIEITDKVIEKQMRTVQEIASLLGETTAETKIVLTKLKETLSDDRPLH